MNKETIENLVFTLNVALFFCYIWMKTRYRKKKISDKEEEPVEGILADMLLFLIVFLTLLLLISRFFN